ncbi:hypothetical protein VNO78_22092 [Psophocarpus tetragonolobus]|uniref:Uncharacterized protein n=1 Tax=Psophocarpus tetragonolobus TaxID=3891 RepID=A0AAN9XIN3_PSOTE
MACGHGRDQLTRSQYSLRMLTHAMAKTEGEGKNIKWRQFWEMYNMVYIERCPVNYLEADPVVEFGDCSVVLLSHCWHHSTILWSLMPRH